MEGLETSFSRGLRLLVWFWSCVVCCLFVCLHSGSWNILLLVLQNIFSGGDHGEVNKPTNKHIRSTLHILRKKRLPRLETTAAADVKIIHCCFFLVDYGQVCPCCWLGSILMTIPFREINPSSRLGLSQKLH